MRAQGARGQGRPQAESARGGGYKPVELAGDKVPEIASRTAAIAPAAGDGCSAGGGDGISEVITVNDDGGVAARDPAVAGFPIAFAKEKGIKSLAGFVVTTAAGARVPAQLEVLSRWGDAPGACGAPIRWAYVHALSAEPSLILKWDPAAASAAIEPAIKIDAGDAKLVFDTGAARFTVSRKAFDGLDAVELKGGGKLAGEGGALSLSRDGVVLAPRARSFELERAGPVVATLAVKGVYGDEGSMTGFTVRLHFYAGSGLVQMDHTFYNGDVLNKNANGATNRILVDRASWKLPLALGDGVKVTARGAAKLHVVESKDLVALRQKKRTPDHAEVAFTITDGGKEVEKGGYADHPLLAASGPAGVVGASIAHLAMRDPQGVSFDPAKRALEVEWVSEPMYVGGARGVWSRAAVIFGPADGDPSTRGAQAYAHVSRPRIGVPSAAYLTSTRARTPIGTRAPEGDLAKYPQLLESLHDKTAAHLTKYRFTGLQIWPDLPRETCSLAGTCETLEKGYFEGGDSNYWDWSRAELEGFFRTAQPKFLHDFALGQAITMAETISFRPAPEKERENFIAGFAPCYGSGRGFDGPWMEGLNHRRDNCPSDYSYNKVHQLAYILTADRRFTDFFDVGARAAVNRYGLEPKGKTEEYFELSAARASYQHLEMLLDAAEFGRVGGDARAKQLQGIVLKYFDFMAATAFERGHACHLMGSGFADPKLAGKCPNDQAWMLPVQADWAARVYGLMGHAPAGQWLLDLAKTSAANVTVLGENGLPDLSKAGESSPENAKNGWRTTYQCEANKSGIQDATCVKGVQMENDGRFYPDGIVAYLNVYGLILGGGPPGDPARVCAWLPGAYAQALKMLGPGDYNDSVWGKSSGQSFAFSDTTLAALEACKKP